MKSRAPASHPDVKRLVLAPLVLAVLMAPGAASAQGLTMVGPTLGPPKVQWVGSAGDASGTAGGGGPGPLAFEPLRLALYGDAVPIGRTDPGCQEHVEVTGTATAGAPGFALQHALAMRLVPRLTLVGFGRGGCGLDSAVAGGLVFTQPIAPKVWLVGSAGVLHLPHYGPGGTPVTKSTFRADVLFQRSGGRSFTVGVSNRGVSFGGAF